MPRYLSLHTLACLTRQGAEELSKQLAGSDAFDLRGLAVNMTEGKMLVEMEAEGRETIERWFAQQKFHRDWLLRIEWEWKGGKLTSVS